MTLAVQEEKLAKYYLTYDQRKQELNVRFASKVAQPYIAFRGSKAQQLFTQIIDTFRINAVEYQATSFGRGSMIEIGPFTGAAVTLYLTIIYGARDMSKWRFVLSDLLSGKVLFAKFLMQLQELATTLSDYYEIAAEDRIESKQIISPKALRLVSRVMRDLIMGITRTTH